MKRLKVPPALNQFSHTIDRSTGTLPNIFLNLPARDLFKLLKKYKPETRKEKRERLNKAAEKKAAGEKMEEEGEAPKVVKFGLNHVTHLIEQGTARLVVIAHDVNPVELVLWLPQLCRRKDIPFMIVKGQSRLGKMANLKTATCLAVTSVNP